VAVEQKKVTTKSGTELKLTTEKDKPGTLDLAPDSTHVVSANPEKLATGQGRPKGTKLGSLKLRGTADGQIQRVDPAGIRELAERFRWYATKVAKARTELDRLLGTEKVEPGYFSEANMIREIVKAFCTVYGGNLGRIHDALIKVANALDAVADLLDKNDQNLNQLNLDTVPGGKAVNAELRGANTELGKVGANATLGDSKDPDAKPVSTNEGYKKPVNHDAKPYEKPKMSGRDKEDLRIKIDNKDHKSFDKWSKEENLEYYNKTGEFITEDDDSGFRLPDGDEEGNGYQPGSRDLKSGREIVQGKE
jgi:hypothetical protein